MLEKTITRVLGECVIYYIVNIVANAVILARVELHVTRDGLFGHTYVGNAPPHSFGHAIRPLYSSISFGSHFDISISDMHANNSVVL